MPSNEPIDLIIYRVREKGLEIFLVNDDAQTPQNGQWKTLTAHDAEPGRLRDANCIELDPVERPNGESRQAFAVEADWHEIPSLRALMYEDFRVAKEKAREHIKNMLPDLDKGSFVAVKEAFKKVMPEQYAMLKELKDIIMEKNQTKYV
jgi:predicted NUDIX family NTP pyrophosphohydrolase